MQPSHSNRWLSPALLRSATAAAVPGNARRRTLPQAGNAARTADSARGNAAHGNRSPNRSQQSPASTVPPYGYGPTGTRTRDRQLLMLLLASTLLLGSAAFSYVAWSNTAAVPGTATAQISAAAAGSAGESRAHGIMALASPVAAREDAAASMANQRHRVLALREENDRLRRRFDALRDGLTSP